MTSDIVSKAMRHAGCITASTPAVKKLAIFPHTLADLVKLRPVSSYRNSGRTKYVNHIATVFALLDFLGVRYEVGNDDNGRIAGEWVTYSRKELYAALKAKTGLDLTAYKEMIENNLK